MQVEGRSAILIDDGLATGASMRAASRALRPRAREVIVAVPVASERTCAELKGEVDKIKDAAAVLRRRNVLPRFRADNHKEVRSLLSQAPVDNATRAAYRKACYRRALSAK